MVPSTLSTLLGQFMYTSDAACRSTLYALFTTELMGGEYVCNAPNYLLSSPTFTNIIRDMDPALPLMLVTPLMMASQNLLYGDVVWKSSPVSLDVSLQDALYKWSMGVTGL
jgi:hypothetical protein